MAFSIDAIALFLRYYFLPRLRKITATPSAATNRRTPALLPDFGVGVAGTGVGVAGTGVGVEPADKPAIGPASVKVPLVDGELDSYNSGTLKRAVPFWMTGVTR
jgi:hypothetical protein